MPTMLDHPLAHVTPHHSDLGVNYGEVFTRRWVVDLILDQCGYQADVDLTLLTAVEPAAGSGAFLGPALERLLSARAQFQPGQPWEQLATCLFALDLQPGHAETCRRLAVRQLAEAGCPQDEAEKLANSWIRQGDFLLDDFNGLQADVVIGNPPYIRIEELGPELLAAYRAACPTMTGRSDVYIGFYERGLEVLKPGGRLAFICADRWMRNQYGHRLREKILFGGFAVDNCIVMHDVNAFADDVAAYPAITVLRRGIQGEVAVAEATALFDRDSARRFSTWAENGEPRMSTPAVNAARLPHWHKSAESWPEASPETIAWLEDLAEELPVLEDAETGTRISIGIATGADAVYLTKDPDLVESARLLPLAMAADIKSGYFSWTNTFLVNPWDENGLVDLAEWPGLAAYFHEHELVLRGRNVGKRNPVNWHRTIDRVTHSLIERPKLLLQDMKRRPEPVLEPGGFYPHHNLYHLTSDQWDLEVLGGLLLSDVVERQISAYCVKMRGKTLRFQAQYLRRVRAPRPGDIEPVTAAALAEAFRTRDRNAATEAALRAYGIDSLPA
jgi:adenine-specific DNA-methyltransferase